MEEKLVPVYDLNVDTGKVVRRSTDGTGAGNGVGKYADYLKVFGTYRGAQRAAVATRFTDAERAALRAVGVTLPGMPGEAETAEILVRDALIAMGELDPREGK